MKRSVVLWLAGFSVVACSSNDGLSVFDGGADGNGDPGDGFNPPIKNDAAPPSGDGGLSLFYANDDHSLYQLDPSTLAQSSMKLIGDFDCVPSQASVMTDIAVSKDGKLFGVSATAAWPLSIQTKSVFLPDAGADAGVSDGGSIDGGSSDGGPSDASVADAGPVTKTIVHCDAKWPLPFGTHFNGLTFSPENTVSAKEVLIGGNALGNLYAIDQSSGNPTIVGTLGINKDNSLPWGVSGDIVFMANDGSPIGFATARTCTSNNACDPVDTLLEIDVKALKLGNNTSVVKAIRGQIKRSANCGDTTHATFGAIFGIVALGSKVYGFSRWGDFLTIDNDTGGGCYNWSAPGVNFAGAGITTTAPVTAPPPR